LQQAVSLIEHLLHSEKLPASAITLIGDSAGAHLVLSLILHLSHRNPLVSPLEIEGRFASVVLISPWVAMNSSAESIQVNRRKDILSAAALTYWAQNFLGGAVPDPWNTPLMAPEDWWAEILADEVIAMYGDDELLRDDAAILCEKLKVR
jgi:acetyl esterase/lipase